MDMDCKVDFIEKKWLQRKYQLQNYFSLKSASNLNGNLNCSKELEHYAS